MKKVLLILICLMSFSTYSFAGAENFLYIYLNRNLDCGDISMVERAIKLGADVNYKEKADENLYLMVLKRDTENCRQVAELLKANGAVYDEKVKAAYDKKQPEYLEKEIIRRVNECDLKSVQNAIAKGADKDTKYDESFTIMARAAIHGSPGCAAIAHYLSSIGADSSGVNEWNTLWHKYDKPKVFENQHLRMTLNEVDIIGDSNLVVYVLTNDDENPIYIYSVLLEVDGHKRLTDHFKRQKLSINNRGREFLDIFSPFLEADKETRKNIPKIINNRTTFKRQITLTYQYKGKIYTLKTPMMTEDYEVEYRVTSPLGVV
ncbi:MAG: hypothetical protein LBI78_02055 [Campylobacteraceae bacterium]|jgi:hypothetical protein|nr:hypothetical protein [Campylobacteraceae bacterium]